MTPVDALNLALTKEKASVALYRRLSEKNPAIKDLLFYLLNEEEKHEKLINEKIVELTKDA